MMILPMKFSRLVPMFRAGVALGIICVLLGLAPFAVAQDVHHELAAADTDGHEHSDTDLCQWVQHHTSGSIDLGGPVFTAWEMVGRCEVHDQSIFLPVDLASVGPCRAPPRL
jgi:hypothetical protein